MNDSYFDIRSIIFRIYGKKINSKFKTDCKQSNNVLKKR